MRRLQANFSRDLQNTLSLLEQPDLGSPGHGSHTFTHKKPLKQNPIQIITATEKPYPLPLNNSKNKPKRISPNRQAIPKRRAPPRKPKRVPDNSQLTTSSTVLKTPISPSDPNIQSMFSLFCLERTYRKKCLERVFNIWYRKMTRQLLLKLRHSHDDTLAPLSLQSSSLVQINSVSTSNQLTQTEYITSDSGPFSLASDDHLSEIDELSDTQLITSITLHRLKRQSSVEDNLDENDDQNNINYYNNTNNDDYNDNFNKTNYEMSKNDRYDTNRNDKIKTIEKSFDEYEKDKKEDDKVENPAESSFLSWKANSMIRKVFNQSYDLVTNVLETPAMSSENSQTYSETTEEYIPIPMSSDHSETIDPTSNSLNNKSRDSGSDSFSNEIEQSTANIINAANTKITKTEIKINDSIPDAFIDASVDLPAKPNQALFVNLDDKNLINNSKITTINNNINNSFKEKLDNEKTTTPERKLPTPKKSCAADKKTKSSSPMPMKNSDNVHVPLKERFRPPPINPNAVIVKKVVDDFKTSQKVAQTVKPENELKRFLRQFFSEELFESIKTSQLHDKQIPFIKIPPNIQKPWQFTEEYCDLIVDVVTEIAESSNMINYNYESFLEYLSNFFEKAHNQRQKTVLPELEAFRQKKFNEFLVNYSLDVADSFLHFQLDSVLGV